jgi:hypothetical protein
VRGTPAMSAENKRRSGRNSAKWRNVSPSEEPRSSRHPRFGVRAELPLARRMGEQRRRIRERIERDVVVEVRRDEIVLLERTRGELFLQLSPHLGQQRVAVPVAACVRTPFRDRLVPIRDDDGNDPEPGLGCPELRLRDRGETEGRPREMDVPG